MIADSLKRPWIVVVGGFLGSGKTSLILAAARALGQRGIRSAAVLNDQGEELVDTLHMRTNGVASQEVTGGCFCCRFSQLESAIEALRMHAPEVIFAEPVGSCTDLCATVLLPLRQSIDRYRVAPLTVLVDPARTQALSQEGADAAISYLWSKQVQEADLVCISKSDLNPKRFDIPGVPSRHLSAETGHGVMEWLDEVMGGVLEVGSKTLEIDYQEYARAEAALAWLNLSFAFEPILPRSPATVLGPLLDSLDDDLTEAGIEIAHLKLLDNCATGWLKVAKCGNRKEPALEGDLDASPAFRHELLLNLRALGHPARVREIVERNLLRLDGQMQRIRLDSFSPSAPNPERRIVKNQQ